MQNHLLPSSLDTGWHKLYRSVTSSANQLVMIQDCSSRVNWHASETLLEDEPSDACSELQLATFVQRTRERERTYFHDHFDTTEASYASLLYSIIEILIQLYLMAYFLHMKENSIWANASSARMITPQEHYETLAWSSARLLFSLLRCFAAQLLLFGIVNDELGTSNPRYSNEQ